MAALSDYDKQVREAGYNYIPRTEFLLDPFKIPESESIVDKNTGGIPTLIPRESGDGGFNPYNTDMSTVRQDFNPYEARQAAEIYSRTFNPRSFDPSGQIKDAQVMYNKALQDINDPRPGARGLNARTETFSGQPRLSQEVLDYYGEKILDNQERYRTQGQYVDPYDPRYSSMTEAQKFMDNYPDTYGVPSGVPETGIPAAIKSYMQNSLIGRGLGAAKGFVENVLPFNERAVLEDQARAAGIFTDDVGRIVTDDYNTAGGIMAGYNLNQIDAGTFDKRRATIEKTIADKKARGLDTTVLEERLGLLDEAEEDILGSRKKTDLVSKLRKDKKIAEKKRKEEEAAAAKAEADRRAAKAKADAAAKAEADRRAAIIRERDFAAEGRSDPNDPSRQGASGRRPGSGSGPTVRDDQGDRSSGQTGGYSYDSGGRQGFGYGLADGGRVYYMDGGLADLVDIYD